MDGHDEFFVGSRRAVEDTTGRVLAASTQAGCAGTVTFDPVPTVGPGTWQVLAVVDPDGEVTESDEGNDVTHFGKVVVQ